jgi:hypothetical protein
MSYEEMAQVFGIFVLVIFVLSVWAKDDRP